MDQEFYRQQCLQDLADSYDAKGGGPSRASRAIERPLPLARAALAYGGSGEI